MKYKAVLFDLDGTLLDYTAAQRKATDNSTKLLDLVNSPEVQNYEARGIPSTDSQEMKQAFESAGIQQNPTEFLNNYFGKLSEHGILMEGAKEILESLKGKVKLAVVSNGPGDVQNPRLKKTGIAHYFSHCFFSRDIGIAKPDPAILHLAMKTLKVTKQETLFIGDSTTSDQPAAQAAGIDFFLFKGDFKNPKLRALLR
ncbi:MAG: HAD family hydrolase [Candidatus Sabulitectum sp.]|nr:HAD family hydrolase [Candidatus Sabulitectum sp.]